MLTMDDSSKILTIAQKAFEFLDSPALFTDASGCLIWCNPSFEKLSEYSLSEVIGKKPGEFLQGPDSDSDKISIMSEALKRQEGFEIEIHNYSKSGKKYLTQISCEPVFNEAQQLIGFFSIQPRVTRKKLIEERKLADSKRLLEAIISNAEVAVIIADDDMVVRTVNPFACKILGYTNDELVGMSVMDYTRKVIQAENLWDDFMDRETQTGDIELLNKSGAVVYGKYKAIANVLPGKHLSVITDITKRKHYEREILSKNHELEEANESMNTLFSIIGHDLRSPLVSLQTALELLDRPNVDPNKYKRLFEGIAKELDSNKSMLNNLLNWANQQRGGFKINLKKVDIPLLVNELCELHEQRAIDKEITLEMNFPSDTLPIETDEEALRMILRNLCANAIKFCKAGDKISMSLVDLETSYRFEVADTGKGIAPEDLTKIFSTGFSTRGSKNEKGTGLGLTLCNEFLTLLDSKLQVESELGVGTKFYFDLKK